MTPEQITSWLAANLHRFDQPNQWLGTEPNAGPQDWGSAQVRWLLAASWPYFHAAGNQSIPAVAQSIQQAGYLTDRSYLPETPRDLRNLEKAGLPLFGIESKHQASDFDVVSTSISYVVLLMNFRKMLKMSGIPPRWRDRARTPGSYPMVVIGGQGFCAPEPLAVIADAIWCGEVEDEPGYDGGIGQFCQRIQLFKETGQWASDREACYRQLALEFGHVYFPRYVETFYRPVDKGLEHPSKQVAGWRSLLPGMRLPIVKRYVHDLDAIKPLTAPPLLFTDPGLGGGDLETSRGCPAWCSFCRLTYAQKPFRQRSIAATVEHAQTFQRNIGSWELSPFGPDFPMQTNKKRLLAALMQHVNSTVDATAMRIDDFTADPEFIQLQALGGMDSATLGLEGNSQRMRDLVGKGVSDAEVELAVARGLAAGLKKFKLFMITNLPGEDAGDVMRIVQLARKLADLRDSTGQTGVRIQFSWTPLLIEAMTPFQWFAPTPPEHQLIEVAEAFRELKIDFKIGTKAEPNKTSFFQLCQRASAEVAEAIDDVLEEVGSATWGGVAKDFRERLDASLKAHGFLNGFADCFDERDQDDLFGWEFVSTGVSDRLIWDTFARMRDFAEQTESETYDRRLPSGYHGAEWLARCDERCMGNSCGVCSRDDLKLRQAYIAEIPKEAEVDVRAVRPVDDQSVAMRLRGSISRPVKYSTVPNSHWRFAIRRAAYRAGEKLPGSIAKHSIQFASDAFAFKDWVAGEDIVDFGWTVRLDEGQQRQLWVAMQQELDEWLLLGYVNAMPASISLRGVDRMALYTLSLDQDPDKVASALAWWDREDYIKITLKLDTAYFGLGTEDVNAKDHVHGMWLVREGSSFALRMLLHGRVGPYQAAAALLAGASWIPFAARRAWREAVFPLSIEHGLLTPDCQRCAGPVPVDLLDTPFDLGFCPRCLDEDAGIVVAGLPHPVPV